MPDATKQSTGGTRSLPALPGPVAIVTGPTASGKSAAALLLARRIGGEIVCADSMQIYRDMDIGTAKPSAADRQLVRHHMYDFLSPEETFSVAQYVQTAAPVLREILSRGNLPILCGGTGQYISALMSGMEFIPVDTDPALRARLEEESRTLGMRALLERLASVDPQSAERLHERDEKRILRALEIYELTGMTKTQMNAKSLEKGPAFSFAGFCLTLDRERLYRSIDERVGRMLEAGLLEEVRSLKSKYPHLSKTALQAIGYKELDAYLTGSADLEEAAAGIRQSSRNYAKRQLTWFRGISDLEWIDNADPDVSAGIMERRIREIRKSSAEMADQMIRDGE